VLARHVACIGEKRNHSSIWLENKMKRNLFEELDVNGRIILKTLFKI
jgi:hypothetical protein